MMPYPGLRPPQETDPNRLSGLGDALAALANKMEPQAAAEIAKGLVAALENPQITDPNRLSGLGNALAALANKMEPQAAAEIAKGLAAALENPQETDSNRLSRLGLGLAAVCRLLPSAHRTDLLALSNMLLQPMSKEAAEGKEQRYDRKLLAEVCAQLSTEKLALVLKYPFCTGEAEHIVLLQLGTETGRDFAGNVWKFVEQADALGIRDIESPAQRPSARDALKELPVQVSTDMVAMSRSYVITTALHVVELGLDVAFITSQQSQAMAGAMPPGARVMEIESGGAATKAGLNVGDIIEAIGGQKIDTLDDMRKSFRELGPGKTPFTVRRADGRKTVLVDCPNC
jgi:hypothetical protein